MTTSLREELFSIASSYWDKHESPILLSALGGKLSTEAKAERAADGRPLAAYLASEMSSEIRVVPAVGRGGAAVPLAKAADKSDEELEALLQPAVWKPSADTSIKRHPMIWPELWAVFRDGVDSQTKTLVEFRNNGGVLVHRDTGDSPIDPSWHKIEIVDIADADMANGRRSPFAIGESVRRWASKNGIPVHQVQDKVSQASAVRIQRVGDKSRELIQFADGLGVLPLDDLARVHLPADIIVRLIRRTF